MKSGTILVEKEREVTKMNYMKRVTPCDWMDECPYNAQSSADCEHYCDADETKSSPEVKTDKQIEKDDIWMSIENCLESIAIEYYTAINADEIIKDLIHIQNCLAKGVYDKED